MRYIELDDIQLPEGWQEKASAATAAVRGGANPNEFAAVWREIKPKLANLLREKKCWFCESPNDRSDNAVDHFRPKNRVSDAANEHLGYRWLAFELENFRYACTFCNSKRIDQETKATGGKADRFPLLEEATRVYEEGAVAGERVALLDPCEPGDAELLGCKLEDGFPCCTTPQDPVAVERVDISIPIYNLDHDPICKARHQAAKKLRNSIDLAKLAFQNLQTSSFAKAVYRKEWKSIRRVIQRDAPYSGEMRFILSGARSGDDPWIDALLIGA